MGANLEGEESGQHWALHLCFQWTMTLLGLPVGLKTPMSSQSSTRESTHAKEKEHCQLDTPHIWAKGTTTSVEPNGETESAAPAMHDTLEPRAHDGAGRGSEELPRHGECGPEASP